MGLGGKEIRFSREEERDRNWGGEEDTVTRLTFIKHRIFPWRDSAFVAKQRAQVPDEL